MKQKGDEIKWSNPFFCLWKVLSLALGIYANCSPLVMNGINNGSRVF